GTLLSRSGRCGCLPRGRAATFCLHNRSSGAGEGESPGRQCSSKRGRTSRNDTTGTWTSTRTTRRFRLATYARRIASASVSWQNRTTVTTRLGEYFRPSLRGFLFLWSNDLTSSPSCAVHRYDRWPLECVFCIVTWNRDILPRSSFLS